MSGSSRSRTAPDAISSIRSCPDGRESRRRLLFQPQPCRDRLPGSRGAEAIALQEVHARGEQKALLFGVLHAFCDQLEAERAADADDGMHDGRVDRGTEIGNEAAVNLDLLERKPSQIIEAGIAGAEIVEHECHALRGKLL